MGGAVGSTGDAAKAVWLGNLPEEATFKELMELGKQVGAPSWAEKTGSNRGYLLFKSAPEATSAIESLNGAYVGDNEIEADKWTGKLPPQKGGIKGGSVKGGKKKDTAKCVWIGNIPEGCTFKELKELGDQAGECKYAQVFEGKGKGTGLLLFATEEEVPGAIATLSGAQIGDAVIEADVWEKAEKTA